MKFLLPTFPLSVARLTWAPEILGHIDNRQPKKVLIRLASLRDQLEFYF